MSFAARATAALVLALACAGAGAQAGTTGTIEGRVFDDDRRGLPNAIVSIHAPSFTAQTRSDAKGFYHFLSLYPERYYIVFRRGGNGTLTSEIDVHADQVPVCNARLQPVLTGIMSMRARDNRVVACSF